MITCCSTANFSLKSKSEVIVCMRCFPFFRSDGSFSLHVPTGSYLLEVTNPVYSFEPIRVDVNSKGKIRARRLNNIQPSLVQTLPYPLRLRARGMASYFQQREQWRITDFLFSPMVSQSLLCMLSCKRRRRKCFSWNF